MGNKGAKKAETPAQLTDKEIGALKASSGLSEKEIREIYEEFKKDCPTGKMSKDQFVKLYRDTMKSEDKDGALIDNTYAVFDRNGDGSVDFSEFVLAVSLQNKNDLDSQIELGFEMVDTSADGKISYIEMVEFMRTALSLVDDPKAKQADPQQFATGIFHMLGVETNQKLTKQQFMDGCKKNQLLKEIFGSSA